YASGVVSTGGTLGILMPPSNPLIVYGVITNLSITGLFTAGIIPAFIVAITLMVTTYIIARSKGFNSSMEDANKVNVLKILNKSKWSFAAPFIILGSIYLDITTPVQTYTRH